MESELAGYKSGADSYIGKPFLPEQLTLVIANLFNTRKHIREYFTSLEEKESKPIGISYQDKELISNIVKYVEKNLYDEEFGVETLGKELRISRTHFYRKLKSLTGLSPNDYIRQIRLKKAVQPTLRVDEIIDKNQTATFTLAYLIDFKDNIAYF
jgi:AraC-like DNA-binding protein